MSESLPIIAVFGSTGQQGRSVIAELSKHNQRFRIRALTRNASSARAQAIKKQFPNIELAAMNPSDPQSITTALTNVYGVYLLSITGVNEVSQTKAILDIIFNKTLIQSGTIKIQHIIFGSVVAADEDTGIPHFISKGTLESYILQLQESGARAGYTAVKHMNFLRYPFFLDNFVNIPEMAIKDGKIPCLMATNVPVAMVSVRDFGRLASELFLSPDRYSDWKGHYCDVITDYYSMDEVAAMINKKFGFKDEISQVCAVNERVKLPASVILPVVRKFDHMLDDYLIMFDWWQAGWKSKHSTVRAKDIISNMETLEGFVDRCIVNDENRETYRGKPKQLITAGNVLLAAGVAAVGYGLYWLVNNKKSDKK